MRNQAEKCKKNPLDIAIGLAFQSVCPVFQEESVILWKAELTALLGEAFWQDKGLHRQEHFEKLCDAWMD